MKANIAVLLLTLATSAAASVIDGPRVVERIDSDSHPEHELFKRRGGGGGGGRGGGGGGGSSRGSSGSSSGSSGSSSGGSSRSGSSGSSSGSSGSSSSGSRAGSSPNSGSTRRYGGGYYAGGGATPYPAGQRSRKTGIVPFLLLGTALAFWPGVWLYGAYMYRSDDNQTYKFHNATSDKDEELEVLCACSPRAQCGCEENTDEDYLDDLVGDGDYAKLNKDQVDVAVVNGTKTLLINGTLPDDASTANTAAGIHPAGSLLGLWPAVAAVVAAVYMI